MKIKKKKFYKKPRKFCARCPWPGSIDDIKGIRKWLFMKIKGTDITNHYLKDQ